MIEYKKLSTKEEIYERLIEFEICFPHLKEKVPSLLDFANKLNIHAEVYIAIETKKNIGISCFYANDLINYTGYIALIGVIKEKRGLGFGKRLLDFTEFIMRKKNMKYIKLEVDADNDNALHFYERNGFEKIAQLDNGFYMVKELNYDRM